MWGRGVDNIEKSSQAKKSLVFQLLSHVQLFVTPWTVAHQAPLFTEFSRQGQWSGCHFLLQGIFLTKGSNLCLLCLLYWQVDSLPLGHLGSSVYVYIGILFSH